MDLAMLTPTDIAALVVVGGTLVTVVRYLVKLGVILDAIEKRYERFEATLSDHETRISRVEGELQ